MDFRVRSRTELEEIEVKTLSPLAQFSRGAHTTRLHEEKEHDYRTAFQRDRDRIIHSRAFRRLKHKRQVFLTTESDHYRTRITHTLEVSQLARTMARVLGLNIDLVEAIALGHDIGHTPFGHLGEVILDKIMTGKRHLKGQKPGLNLGGFKHNYQSVRIVDKLEKKYLLDGLNLTAPVREGILKHTGLRKNIIDYPDFEYRGLNYEQPYATTLEGQVVAVSDEIAQRTHDLEDGLRAGLAQLAQVRELEIVRQVDQTYRLNALYEQDELLYREAVIRYLINVLVDDVLQVTAEKLCRLTGRIIPSRAFGEEMVCFSEKMEPLQAELNKFIYKEIIHFSRVQWSDKLAEKLIFRLFEAYYLKPELLPDYLVAGFFDDPSGDGKKLTSAKCKEMQDDSRYVRLICDYIAGMTDYFALREAERLAQLQQFRTDDLHLETALGKIFVVQ